MGLKKFVSKKVKAYKQRQREQRKLNAEVKHAEREAFNTTYRGEALRHARARGRKRARTAAKGGAGGGFMGGLSDLSKKIDFDFVNSQLGIPSAKGKRRKKKKKDEPWSLF